MTTATDSDPKIIFLVEDNRGDIRLIQEALKLSSTPYEVVIARDGMEAMSYLLRDEPFTQAVRPDLILLDLNLPKKDGREVLAEIKSNPQLRSIPVVVLTTSSNEEDIHQSYSLYANCYITKSRNLSDLFKIVRGIEEFWLETAALPSNSDRVN